jgi:hypothetical protein
MTIKNILADGYRINYVFCTPQPFVGLFIKGLPKKIHILSCAHVYASSEEQHYVSAVIW